MPRSFKREEAPTPSPPLPRPPWCCCFWLDTVRMKKMEKKLCLALSNAYRWCTAQVRSNVTSFISNAPWRPQSCDPGKSLHGRVVISLSLSLILKSFGEKKTKPSSSDHNNQLKVPYSSEVTPTGLLCIYSQLLSICLLA